MVLASLLRIACVAIGATYFARAIWRRRRLHGAGLDRGVSLGLRVMASLALLAVLGLFAAPVRLALGWPHWVATAGDAIAVPAIACVFLLAAFLGWRMALEERALRQASGDRVT